MGSDNTTNDDRKYIFYHCDLTETEFLYDRTVRKSRYRRPLSTDGFNTRW